MKKILIISLFLTVCFVSFAGQMTSTYTASGTSTVNIASKTGAIIKIMSIYGYGGSTIDVYKANAKGVTTNYTKIGVVGSTGLAGNYGYPVYQGSPGYAYRFILATATDNTLIISWDYKQ